MRATAKRRANTCRNPYSKRIRTTRRRARDGTGEEGGEKTKTTMDSADEVPSGRAGDRGVTETTSFEKRLMEQFAKVNGNIVEVKTSVDKLTANVDANTAGIREVRATVDKNRDESKKSIADIYKLIEANDEAVRKEIRFCDEKIRKSNGTGAERLPAGIIREKVSKEVDKLRAIGNVANLHRPKDYENEKEKSYWLARRSLKMWPIPGITEKEIWGSVGRFLEQKLDTYEIVESDIESVRRVYGDDRRGKIKQEVLVRFRSLEVRDVAASRARNLAGFVDQNRQPTAGIRPDVPVHLISTYKTLDAYALQL